MPRSEIPGSYGRCGIYVYIHTYIQIYMCVYIYIYIYIYIYTHTHNGILLRYTKEWNNAVCSMEGCRDYHTKWSKPDRKRQTSYDIAYM